jgi:shikimate dehydrogenase
MFGSTNTQILALIGNPVSQSLSPKLHKALNKYFGNDYMYIPCEIDEDELQDSVNGLIESNALGFNVTIPYKEKMPDILDWISDEVKVTGSVNTVKIHDGKTEGYSTDGKGFLAALKMEYGLEVESKTLFIFGAGGSALAIAHRCVLENANRIYIANRTFSKARHLCNKINSQVCIPVPLDENEYIKYICEADIIVNTTSLGMKGQVNLSPLSDDITLNPSQLIYDIVYNPAETKFISQGKKFGCKTMNGMGMLCMQGVYSYQIWTGQIPDEYFLRKLISNFPEI